MLDVMNLWCLGQVQYICLERKAYLVAVEFVFLAGFF